MLMGLSLSHQKKDVIRALLEGISFEIKWMLDAVIETGVEIEDVILVGGGAKNPYWNQIHADPLVWTVDRPLATAAPFARHATGIMMYGDIPAGENSVEYHLFADDSDVLDPRQENEVAFEDSNSGTSPLNAFERAAGGRVSYHFLDDTANVGISYVRLSMYDLKARNELFGVDALWTVKRMEFSSEWVYRNGLGSSQDDEHGGFVQAVLPLPYRLYLVGRHETFSATAFPPTATLNIVGINFRPHEAFTIKLEHREGKHNELLAPSGWLGSLAILF